MKFDGWTLLITVALILYFAVEYYLWRKERRNKQKGEIE